MTEANPLSLGQLSVWHDIRDLRPERRHEPNNAAVWALPPGTRAEAVSAAVHALALHHPSLRTRYDLEDPDEPRQLPPDKEVRAPVDLVDLTDPGGDGGQRPAEIALALAARPFDLGREHGWRARLLARDGAPSHLVFVKHHIVADAWAQEQLHQELLREITAPGRLGPPPPGPADLAADQHSPAGRRRQRAALAHWEHVLAATPPTALPRDAEAPGAVVQGTLRSARARAAARTIAAREGVSLAGVVLAAFAGAVARRCDAGGTGTGDSDDNRLMVQLMSANRFTARWRDVVTSMNQWVPALIEDTSSAFADLARAAHWSGLAAFRHGMHDVRAVAALRDRLPRAPEPACAFNFVAVPPGAAGTAPDGSGTGPESEATVVWEEPFTTIGPRCYARALEDEHTLSVRLTARDLRRETCAALLWDLHDALLTAAGRA